MYQQALFGVWPEITDKAKDFNDLKEVVLLRYNAVYSSYVDLEGRVYPTERLCHGFNYEGETYMSLAFIIQHICTVSEESRIWRVKHPDLMFKVKTLLKAYKRKNSRSELSFQLAVTEPYEKLGLHLGLPVWRGSVNLAIVNDYIYNL